MSQNNGLQFLTKKNNLTNNGQKLNNFGSNLVESHLLLQQKKKVNYYKADLNIVTFGRCSATT
jgi:hypothetical protein